MHAEQADASSKSIDSDSRSMSEMPAKARGRVAAAISSPLGPGSCRTILKSIDRAWVLHLPSPEQSTRKSPTDPKQRAVREWLTTRSSTTAEF